MIHMQKGIKTPGNITIISDFFKSFRPDIRIVYSNHFITSFRNVEITHVIDSCMYIFSFCSVEKHRDKGVLYKFLISWYS